jgi:hypothetical protein
VRHIDRPRRSAWIRIALLGALLGTAATAPSPSHAADADDGVAAWVGRYCTPQGCRGSLESAVGNAAGFGAAALAAALVARRRPA